MPRNPESGPSNDESQENIKSPEELKFEDLAKYGRKTSISNMESSAPRWEREGDVEHLAILELQKALAVVDRLPLAFKMKEGKHGEEIMKEAIDEAAPILSKFNLEVPKTFEEAKDLRKKIITFENWQKVMQEPKEETKGEKE
jgi:hypothetical protein